MRIMQLEKHFLRQIDLFQKIFRFLFQPCTLTGHTSNFITIFLLVFNNFESLGLTFLNIQMPISLIFQQLQLKFKILILIFLELNIPIVVDTIKLSLGNEDPMFVISNFNLLLLHLQLLLSYQLILFFNFVQPYSIRLLLCFVLH